MSVDLSVEETVALDLEREFLFHLVNKDDLEYAIRDGVSIDLIYGPKNRSVYAFAQHYINETKQAPSSAVFKTEFNIDIQPTETAIHWIVAKLRERYQKNQVHDLTLALADRVDQPAEAMVYLRDKVMEIQRNSMSTKHVWAAGEHKMFLSGLQDKILQGHYKGLPTGFDAVDAFTGGLKPGYLAFLAARPKRQKTFFLLKAFIEQKRAGYKPVLFTLENTVEEIQLRISCLLSGYPWDLAMRGEIDMKGWKLIEEAWDEFAALGDHWISSPPVEERNVAALMLTADKMEADSIILSQFKYIQPMNPNLRRPDHEKFAELVMDLKMAATRPGYERPIYVEAQFNREGESIEEFTDIGLAQLGLTDMIGQASDVVFALYQNKEMRANQQTQFGIIDARNHDKKNWYIRSEFKSTTYVELMNL